MRYTNASIATSDKRRRRRYDWLVARAHEEVPLEVIVRHVPADMFVKHFEGTALHMTCTGLRDAMRMQGSAMTVFPRYFTANGRLWRKYLRSMFPEDEDDNDTESLKRIAYWAMRNEDTNSVANLMRRIDSMSNDTVKNVVSHVVQAACRNGNREILNIVSSLSTLAKNCVSNECIRAALDTKRDDAVHTCVAIRDNARYATDIDREFLTNATPKQIVEYEGSVTTRVYNCYFPEEAAVIGNIVTAVWMVQTGRSEWPSWLVMRKLMYLTSEKGDKELITIRRMLDAGFPASANDYSVHASSSEFDVNMEYFRITGLLPSPSFVMNLLATEKFDSAEEFVRLGVEITSQVVSENLRTETRAGLTPDAVIWLLKRGIDVVITDLYSTVAIARTDTLEWSVRTGRMAQFERMDIVSAAITGLNFQFFARLPDLGIRATMKEILPIVARMGYLTIDFMHWLVVTAPKKCVDERERDEIMAVAKIHLRFGDLRYIRTAAERETKQALLAYVDELEHADIERMRAKCAALKLRPNLKVVTTREDYLHYIKRALGLVSSRPM